MLSALRASCHATLLTAIILIVSGCTESRIQPPLTIEVHSSFEYHVQGVEMDRAGIEQYVRDARMRQYNNVTGTSRQRIEIVQVGAAAASASHDLMLYCQEQGLNHVIMSHAH